jgi:hypothetical protein
VEGDASSLGSEMIVELSGGIRWGWRGKCPNFIVFPLPQTLMLENFIIKEESLQKPLSFPQLVTLLLNDVLQKPAV